MDEPELLGIHDAQRRADASREVETALFEVVGGWVVPEPDLAAKALWATHSTRGGQRAQRWAALTPLLWDARAEAPSADGDPLGVPVAALRAVPVGGAEATLDRLVAVYRVVLPRLAAAYREHLARTSPVADAPTARWLRAAVADVVSDQAAGEQLLAARAPEAELVARTQRFEGG